MKSIVALVCTFLTLWTNAQKTTRSKDVGMITGNVIDSASGKGLASTTIEMRSAEDSSFRRTILTDKEGGFDINALPFGHYSILFSRVGYASLRIDSVHLREERYDLNLGDIKMGTEQTDLQNVIVYAEKPLIENKDGKIVYNVGESAMSAGSNTSELLKNMPLVSNDPNGKILLKGKEPKILIDDKPVELNAQQLNDLLESLPGGSIDRIEMMMNPPPQYASEQGGVINIVTKKGRIGTTGKVSLAAGTRGEATLSSNLSYRDKKVNVNMNASIAGSKLIGTSYSRRRNIYTDSTNGFNTDGRWDNQNARPNFRLQVDHETTKFIQLSMVVQANTNHFDNEGETQYSNINRFLERYRLSTRSNMTDGQNINLSLQPAVTVKTKLAGEVLRFIGGYSYGNNHNDRAFFQQFLDPVTTAPTGLDSTQQQATRNRVHNYSLRVNYDRPLKLKGWVLSAGGSWGRTENHNVLTSSFLKKPENIMVLSAPLSTDVRFMQDIYTIRAGMTMLFGQKTRLITNFQGEHTAFEFFIKSSGLTTDNGYWNFLPSVTLRQDLNKESNVSLVYRKSIRRPGIGELNPAIDYGDPYNLRFGNPTLAPSVAHNFDLNYSLTKGKYYVNTSLGYNDIRDIFNTIRTLQSDGKTFVTWQNIDNRKEYELSVWGGYTFSKAFRLNASTGYTYNQYGQRQKELYKYRDGGSFYASFNYNLTFSPLLTMDGNFRYSSFADPQGRSRSNVTMNAGVQYRFFERRLTVGLNVADPFRTSQLTTYTYGSNFFLENFNSNRTKNYRIVLTWQLNRNPSSKKKVQMGKGDLQQLLKK